MFESHNSSVTDYYEGKFNEMNRSPNRNEHFNKLHFSSRQHCCEIEHKDAFTNQNVTDDLTENSGCFFLQRDVIIDEERTNSCLLHSSGNEQSNRFSTLFSSS